MPLPNLHVSHPPDPPHSLTTPNSDQSLYSVPAQLGATVSLWHASAENSWLPSLSDLQSLIQPTTKLLILNNPNNPTGAILPKPLLQEILDLAAAHNSTVLADEVYRPIFHSISPIDASFPPSALSMGHANVVVTGSMSKAYALAGIRVGRNTGKQLTRRRIGEVCGVSGRGW